MNSIRIRRLLESQVLDLPELKPMVGKSVEIVVTEEAGGGDPSANRPGQLASQTSPNNPGAQAVADLLAQWEAQDHSEDNLHQVDPDLELDEFRKAMNRNRNDMEGPESRVPFT